MHLAAYWLGCERSIHRLGLNSSQKKNALEMLRSSHGLIAILCRAFLRATTTRCSIPLLRTLLAAFCSSISLCIIRTRGTFIHLLPVNFLLSRSCIPYSTCHILNILVTYVKSHSTIPIHIRGLPISRQWASWAKHVIERLPSSARRS